MTHRYWPLFDLRLGSPDLALRPMTEADLAVIADLLHDDQDQAGEAGQTLGREAVIPAPSRTHWAAAVPL